MHISSHSANLHISDAFKDNLTCRQGNGDQADDGPINGRPTPHTAGGKQPQLFIHTWPDEHKPGYRILPLTERTQEKEGKMTGG